MMLDDLCRTWTIDDRPLTPEIEAALRQVLAARFTDRQEDRPVLPFAPDMDVTVTPTTTGFTLTVTRTRDQVGTLRPTKWSWVEDEVRYGLFRAADILLPPSPVDGPDPRTRPEDPTEDPGT